MNKKEYGLHNRRWLALKAAEPDVHKASEGVYYRILASGDATKSKPSLSSVVTVRYTGMTCDGREFDSTRGQTVAPAFRVRDLIEGWQDVLSLMHPGDRWEVYISADKGYGKQPQPGIPGNSTLIFDMELTGIA